ncbi:MAG: FecR domain-containing protein [Candidatus Neomarinimicrobiota bacterium]
MSEPSDWTMLARYLAGECTAAETRQLEAWMSADSENRLLVERMQAIWAAPEPSPTDIDVKRVWLEVAAQAGLLEQSRVGRSASRVKNIFGRDLRHWQFWPAPTPALRFALVVTLIIALPLLVARWGGWLPWDAGSDPLIAVHIDQGKRSRVMLSDGSSVILDAGTTLRHPAEFAGDVREVYLDGEGFFEVVDDADWPFIVHAADAQITVLGTKFNVRAWEPDQRIRVAVAEGHVALHAESTGADEGVVIHEGQGSTMLVNGQPGEPVDITLDEHLGWMNNEAVFRDVPLREVLFQVERWYDLSFELTDPSVAGERVTVYLRRNSVQDILELISSLTEMPFKRNGRVVRLGLLPAQTPEAIEAD